MNFLDTPHPYGVYQLNSQEARNLLRWAQRIGMWIHVETKTPGVRLDFCGQVRSINDHHMVLDDGSRIAIRFAEVSGTLENGLTMTIRI